MKERDVRLALLLAAILLWLIGHIANLAALRGLATFIDFYCIAWMLDEWWASRHTKARR